jgi:hypothetical protein
MSATYIAKVSKVTGRGRRGESAVRVLFAPPQQNAASTIGSLLEGLGFENIDFN